MKKSFRFLFSIAIFLIVTIFLVVSLFSKKDNISQVVPNPTVAPQVINIQSKILFASDKITDIEAGYEFETGKTAFDLLTETASENDIQIETQKYDFGIFIKSIEGFENTKDNAWIYYVNGKAGDVAADKYILKNGDVVEWRYEKPIY
jgi:hypothetical protein